MARSLVVTTIASIVTSSCQSQPKASFETDTKRFSAMNFGELGSSDDATKFEAVQGAAKAIWDKYPECRNEFLRPWLVTPKGDLTRKSILLSLVDQSDWKKGFSESQKKKVEAVLADEIKVEKSNLILTLCKIVEKQRLKSAIPALEAAAKSREEGSPNRKEIERVLKLLNPVG